MRTLTDNEKKIISSMKPKRLAMIWCRLNSFQVPKQFKEHAAEIKIEHSTRPQDWKEYIDNSIGVALMHEIEKFTSQRQRSFAWWIREKLEYLDHDEWFNENFPGVE